jgi:Probable transposase.
LSTGEQIENPRFLRQSEDDLAKAQQRLSTKKRRSGKRRKQKKIVSQIHRKIQNQRKDHAHKLSNYLIERFDANSQSLFCETGSLLILNLAKKWCGII